MAKRCEVCGKGPQFGNRVSHSHKASRRRFNPNLQKMKVIIDGEKRRAKVCTSCLKSGKVERYI